VPDIYSAVIPAQDGILIFYLASFSLNMLRLIEMFMMPAKTNKIIVLLICALSIATLAVAQPAVAAMTEAEADALAVKARGGDAAAMRQIQQAAVSGDVAAEYEMGVMFANADDPRRMSYFKYGQAAEWYRRAAIKGHAKSQNALGLLYTAGRGVAPDYEQATELYRKAAEQGYADAQYNLGLAYDLGRGLGQDYEQAVKWYRLAADQGHANAQTYLGLKYLAGQGVPKDVVLAYMLFSLATAGGNFQAAAAIDQANASKWLLPNQIKEGEELKANWKPGNPLPTQTKTGAQGAE
jgi:TPR repeat protein